MIHGIIDIGSNTVRMAIYDISGDRIEFLMKKKHLVGLAAYLENNVMTKAGIDKVCEVLFEFRSFLEIFRIKSVVAFTTAALRNCHNSREAVDEIIRRTGIDIEIISGDREAEYDFIGATRNIEEKSGVLVDIGGASTELVSYSDGRIVNKISLPMGSLDFRTKYCSCVLPNEFEVSLMREKAAKLLEGADGFSGLRCNGLVGIGGTFKGACALYNAMYSHDKKNLVMEADCLEEMINHFSRLEEIGHEDAVLLMKQVPDRINTIIPGMVIADVLVKSFQCGKITYSDSGVREGFIYSHLV